MVRTTNFKMQILPAARLNKALWDLTVRKAANGSLFAAYDYLQHMAPAWSGLVIGEYAAVLPLIYKSKFGIRYLAALPFVRQLGLIGQLPVHMQNKAAYGAIFEKIHGFASYGDICFNHANEEICREAGLLEAKAALPNFELDLQKPYTELTAGYLKSLKSKLRKLNQNADLCLIPADPHIVLKAYQALLLQRSVMDLSADFKRLHQLTDHDFGKAHFSAYQVIGKGRDEQPLLYGIYGKDTHRIYNFMTALNPAGRKAQAGVFALDQLIARHASSGLRLDFMGSGLAGVRNFILGFGAENYPYYLYHYNRLPWPLRLLKK